jgi:L-2-hydroxyglutarate oxidase LhgO
MEKINLNATIIGGGIIGLLTAYEIKKTYPNWEVALLEAATFLGDHSTGRNSGVLHAGLYYLSGSQKHLLCLEGIEIWKKDLCPKLSIQFNECGKFIFAKNQEEVSALEEIWKKATANGVQNLSWPTDAKLQEMKKYVKVQTGFFSPQTGILDVTGAIKKLANEFENLGGMIAKNCIVLNLSREHQFRVETNQFEIKTDVVINAGGFYGPAIREKLCLKGLSSALVKGNYISTSQKIGHPHLFYPVPPKDLKGLGVHSTLDLEGKIKFGPNTEDVSSIDYSDSGVALSAMKPEITNTFVGIDETRLYWDYAGIRSKLINTETGKLETDFWIKSPISGYIECLGIESPGLTSAPAIAKKIVRDFIS